MVLASCREQNICSIVVRYQLCVKQYTHSVFFNTYAIAGAVFTAPYNTGKCESLINSYCYYCPRDTAATEKDSTDMLQSLKGCFSI